MTTPTRRTAPRSGPGRVADALTWRWRRVIDFASGPAGRHRTLARLRGGRARRRSLREMSRHGRPSVLIGLIEHLGDLVAAEPIGRLVRARHPDARVLWAVRPAYAPLIQRRPEIDGLIHVDCLTEWFELRRAGESRETLVAVYDLHPTGRLCPTCGLRQVHPGSRNIDGMNYYAHGDLVTIFAKLAGLHPFPIHFDPAPRLTTSIDERATADGLGLPERFVVVHGRSNQDVRDWNDAGWAGLTDRLTASGRPVVEVGLTPVLPRGTPGVTDLCGRASPLVTAEVIRRASLFVGIDSGPAHLANAVGTPGVILLGRYRAFDRYVPYGGGYGDGTNATLIHWPTAAADIPADVVWDAVRPRLTGHHRTAEICEATP